MAQNWPTRVFDSVDDEVDERCDLFEAAWRRGDRPKIIQFIERADERQQPRLFYELLLVELEYRRIGGEHPSREEYQTEFPQFSDVIETTPFNIAVSGPSDCSYRAGITDLNGRTEQRAADGGAFAPNEPIGDFRVIREIGRGGMGVVYEAEQLSLRRRVALKVLPFVNALNKQQVTRFQSEAYAAATLHHSNIVPVYSIGSDRGIHFYAMQFISGRSVAALLSEMRQQKTRVEAKSTEAQRIGETLTRSITSTIGSGESTNYFRRVADFGVQAAEALEYSHAHGVLHRDVKPANLLVDDDGKLWVTDFGLARAKQNCDLTKSGELLGTLRYMSPEQVSGRQSDIDERTDIYSLGVTLYEMLSLVPAFGGDNEPELLRRIAFDEPPRLRQVNRRIPPDLETIVAKAMEKRGAERYSSALELANDLRRYLDAKPIKAKRASYSDRVVKWSRRHHTLVTSLAIGFVLISAILLASVVMINRSRLKAIDALEATSESLYVGDMAAAFDAWGYGYIDEVQAILDRYRPAAGSPDRRGFEWHLLDRVAWHPKSTVLAGHMGPVNEIVSFSAGRQLASVGDDGTLRIWNVATGTSKTFSLSHDALHSVAVSPDGRHVAAGNKTLYLHDLELKQTSPTRELLWRPDNVESLAFSPDGQKLAAGMRYSELCLLSLEGGVIRTVPCASRVESLEFVPKQSWLLVPNRRADKVHDRHAIAELWRDDLSALEREFNTRHTRRRSEITLAKSSPDGQFIAGGGLYQGRVTVFDAATARVIAETRPGRDKLTALAYSPDGREIAAAYQNGIIERFDVKRSDGKFRLSERPKVIDAHSGIVTSLSYLDGHSLASSGRDGLIKVWDLSGYVKRRFTFDNAPLVDVAVSPDGTLLACIDRTEFKILSSSGEVLTRLVRSGSSRTVTWSPGGDRVAICSDRDEVSIFDRRGHHVLDIPQPGSADQLAFSADQRFVAVVGQTHFQLCDAASGSKLYSIDLPMDRGGVSVAFSHDSRSLAWGDRVGVVSVLDCQSHRILKTMQCESSVRIIAFSPDDSLLATGHEDGVIRIWNTVSGQLKSELSGHARNVREIAFAPDGRTLLSSSADGTVRVWSIVQSRGFGVFHREFEDGVVPLRYDVVCRLSISSDGRRFAVGYNNDNGRAKILMWDIDYSY
jgi:WD40 repeat protein/serine/threonine protein kinase